MASATDDKNVIWLTQVSFDELTAELKELKEVTRVEVVKKVSTARDEGDLKENAGYHAARDELGKLDGRIQQLQDMLERAKVGETPPDDGVVEPGMKVTVRFPALGQEQTFLLGAREMAAEDLEVFSPQSALGEAINGSKKGDTVSYVAPSGKSIDVEILDAVPFVD
ncbi:MAG: transcription elongation factor GreA [Marmoricola sp.]